VNLLAFAAVPSSSSSVQFAIVPEDRGKLTDGQAGRRSWSCQERCGRRGQPSDRCAGGGVEEEVVAGRDDHEQHEGRVERAECADEQVPGVAEQAGSDDQGIAEVHARNGGVGVVERADEAVVEVDVTVRDGVDDADAGGGAVGETRKPTSDSPLASSSVVRTNGNAAGRRWWSQTSTPPVTARWSVR
jgi:hypothetical protein